MLTVGLSGTKLGPVVFDAVQLGYSEGLLCKVALHLNPGGELSFLVPALAFQLVNDSVEFELYPLARPPAVTCSFACCPIPRSSCPRADRSRFSSVGRCHSRRACCYPIGNQPRHSLWTNGPTVRSVVEQSGLVVAGSSPTALAAPLPPLVDIALGGLAALAKNVTLWKNSSLELSLREQRPARHPLKGRQDIEAGALALSLRFGDAAWIDDADAGVTFWIMEDTVGTIRQAAPSLSLTGLGVVLGRPAPNPARGRL